VVSVSAVKFELSPSPAESAPLRPAAASPTFTGLYRDNHRWLQDWLRRRLGCALDAADLAHDTFLRVLARPDLARLREPRAYLSTVAHGVLVNHLRRRDLERAYLLELAHLPAPLQPDVETRAIVLETLFEIDAMLDGLPAKVRSAFLLAQLEGWSYAQIADHLNVSASSVKQYLRKATLQCLQTCH
jgi:RNA polymerase sigma-19 factor, ECF subfamily